MEVVMGTVSCRNCNGSGRFYDRKSGKTFDCRACGGSGINRNLWSTNCERCRKEIVYKANTDRPRYCKECRNIELSKTCAQMGCNKTILYKIGWNNVSDYCGACRNKRDKGFKASICQGAFCNNLVWSPPGKSFSFCFECNEKKKKADAAKWKEKPCAGGCGNTIKYNTDWDHPPNFCKTCKERRLKRGHEPNQSENPRFHAACGERGAKLSLQEKSRFSNFFHGIPDRQKMKFEEIVKLAEEWKNNNGGGFRRSDKS